MSGLAVSSWKFIWYTAWRQRCKSRCSPRKRWHSRRRALGKGFPAAAATSVSVQGPDRHVITWPAPVMSIFAW
ncbi:MAG: hypothetical protein MUF25_03295 [Pirellulaceae bacterium]|nr:hypothetical protein [Pirellulaceae bacterium]